MSTTPEYRYEPPDHGCGLARGIPEVDGCGLLPENP